MGHTGWGRPARGPAGPRPPVRTAPAPASPRVASPCLRGPALPTGPARTARRRRGPSGANERPQPPDVAPPGLLTCIFSQLPRARPATAYPPLSSLPRRRRPTRPSALFRARAQPPPRFFSQPGLRPAPRERAGRSQREANSPLSLRPLLKRLARKLCACARQDAPTSVTLSQSPGATLLGQVFGLGALGWRGRLQSARRCLKSLPKKSEIETRFSDSVLQLRTMQGYLKQKGESLFTWLSLRRFIFAEVLSPLRGTLEVPSRTQQTEFKVQGLGPRLLCMQHSEFELRKQYSSLHI